MLYILGMILVVYITIIIMALMVNSKITELEEERFNAEVRATIHFRKLYAIENIIKNDEEKHEFITETMKKIKEVITSDQTNK